MKVIEKLSYKVIEENNGEYNVSGGVNSNSPTGWSNFSGHTFKTKLEVVEFLFNKTFLIKENNFVHIVEDRKGNYISFHKTREGAKEKIERIQNNHREALVINCQKIY